MRSVLVLGIGVAIVEFGIASRPPGDQTAPAAENSLAAPSENKLREKLLTLDKQFWEATSNSNVETLAKLLADDNIGFSPDGHHGTKKIALER
jgi:hypothetical protein